MMDALLASPIKFVTCHHEQGAAFMADVYGRLTGEAGVCMSTLGPGRHEPHHRGRRRQHGPRADRGDRGAGRDHAPAQGKPPDPRSGATSSRRSPSTAPRCSTPEITPEIVRKAFKVAQTEKPGGAFIDFPENIAEMPCDKKPIPVQTAYTPCAARRQDRVRGQAHLAGEEPDHPRRQRRDPPGRGRLAGELRRGAEDPRGQHLHGQGRDAVLQRAVARHHRPEGARPAVVRLREGRRRDLRRLRHGRVPPRHVEPGQRQDHHPHRRAAGRGRRQLHREGRRAGRHRLVAARRSRSRPSRASRSASATCASRSPRTAPSTRRTRASRSSRRRSSGTCASASAPRTSPSPTSARTRCG